MSDGYSVDASVLADTGQTLRSVSRELATQASALTIGPDAGASSDEVRTAFADLAAEVRALAEATEAAAVGVEQAHQAYRSSDDSVAQRYDGGTTP